MWSNEVEARAVSVLCSESETASPDAKQLHSDIKSPGGAASNELDEIWTSPLSSYQRLSCEEDAASRENYSIGTCTVRHYPLNTDNR
jgi:hypothetical protein